MDLAGCNRSEMVSYKKQPFFSVRSEDSSIHYCSLRFNAVYLFRKLFTWTEDCNPKSFSNLYQTNKIKISI